MFCDIITLDHSFGIFYLYYVIMDDISRITPLNLRKIPTPFDPIFDPTHDFISIELCFYLLHEAVHSVRAFLFHFLRYMTVYVQRE